MIARVVVQDLVERGEIQMRRAKVAVNVAPPGGLRLHAVETHVGNSLCGFYPASGEWLEPPTRGAAPCGTCLRQLRRAGFSVSWAGVIVAEAS